MEAIWLAIVIYSLGLGLVLYLRPAYMFNENGTWKEFGYKRDSRHTLLPFWLFAIAWALLSYAISMALTLTLASAAIATYYQPEDSEFDFESESEPEPEPEPELMPVSKAKKPRPGYYVLNANTKRSGIKKYVYYGQDKP